MTEIQNFSKPSEDRVVTTVSQSQVSAAAATDSLSSLWVAVNPELGLAIRIIIEDAFDTFNRGAGESQIFFEAESIVRWLGFDNPAVTIAEFGINPAKRLILSGNGAHEVSFLSFAEMFKFIVFKLSHDAEQLLLWVIDEILASLIYDHGVWFSPKTLCEMLETRLRFLHCTGAILMPLPKQKVG